MRTTVRSRPAYGVWDRFLRDYIENPANGLAQRTTHGLRAGRAFAAVSYRDRKKKSILATFMHAVRPQWRVPAAAAALAGFLVFTGTSPAGNASGPSVMASMRDSVSAIALNAGRAEATPSRIEAMPVRINAGLDYAGADPRRISSAAISMEARDSLRSLSAALPLPEPSFSRRRPAMDSGAPIERAQADRGTDDDVQYRRPLVRPTYQTIAHNFERPRWTDRMLRMRGAEDRANTYADIAHAATTAGANPSGLLTTAYLETKFEPGARPRTSSAAGPFQYIQSTWLGSIKKYGSQLGYGHYADAIEQRRGRYYVRNPQLRAEILNMRHDAWLATMVTIELMKEYQTMLEGAGLGRQITSNDLHICHVFGPAGGRKFLRTLRTSPNIAAASIFDADVVAANHNVFYDRRGRAYTLQSVYNSYGSNFAPADRLLRPAPGSDAPPTVVPEETTPTPRAVPGQTNIAGDTRGPTLREMWGRLISRAPANTSIAQNNIQRVVLRPSIG